MEERKEQPPKLALLLFRWYCRPDRVEELEGDLKESYYYDLSSGKSPRKANMIFWWNVIRCAKSYAFKSRKLNDSNTPNFFPMLSNYIKVIIRNFYRNRYYTSLNIAGLALSFSAFILISIYLKYETSFENFHTKSDRIFRTSYHLDNGNGFQSDWARVGDDFINKMPDDLPEIEHLVRFQNHEQKYIKIGDKKYREKHVYVADNEVFKVFDLPLSYGDFETALAEPNSVVISETLARKYFGEEEAYGKEIQLLGDWSSEPKLHKVTGVMSDLPSQTHLPIEMLISFQNEAERTWWAYIYVLLKEGVEVEKFKPKLAGFVKERTTHLDIRVNLGLQPLKDIHLNSNLAREIVPNGSIQNIRIFVIVGLFVLIVGVINFMNLNSAMSLARSKEVGVRKILGAGHSSVICYALIESVVFGLIAMVLAGAISYLVFPYFQVMTGVVFTLALWKVTIGGLGLALLAGVLGGVYPAMVVVGFKPISLIKSNQGLLVSDKPRGVSVKKIMVTAQFAISILLLASALIAADQFQLLNNQNLKMQPEEILAMPRVPDGVTDQFGIFKNELASLPGIKAVSACMEVPSREIRDVGPFVVPGLFDTKESAPVLDVQIVDHDFFDLMNIKLLGGNHISDELVYKPIPVFTEDYSVNQYLADQKRVYIINETAMRQLGWSNSAQAIGRRASWSLGDMELAEGNIVGVVEDYHQETMMNKVDPTVYLFEPLWLRTFMIRIETQNRVETIERMEAKWDEYFPNYPMDFHFLDTLYDQLYQRERQQLELLYIFSGLAIFVAFLGILGLVAYSLKTRIKEIAIRKVLGADISSLMKLISNEYLIMMLVGAILAIPVSYYGISQWLDNFAYHVDISVLNYVIALLIVCLILFLTIGFQTLKSSLANPANVLKDE